MADLLVVADVAAHLGLPSNTDQYEVIDNLIDAAQTTIERYTQRTLATNTTRTEFYDSARYIMVRNPPITSVNAVTDDYHYGARSITLTDLIDEDDDGGRNYEIGKIECAPWGTESGFTGGRLAVQVGYDGGWTTTTLPADLRQAWIDLVCFWFNNRDRLGLDLGALAGAPEKAQNANVPRELREVFLAYRRKL